MKTNVAVILFILTFYHGAIAQDTTRVIGSDKSLYRELLNREFTNLINPQSENIIGNFASLDSKNSELNFAGNFIFSKGSVLGVRLKGGSTDGVLSVFSNSKINSQLGFDIQYNFMLLESKSLTYDNLSYYEYLRSIRKFKYDSLIMANSIEHRKDSTELSDEIRKLGSEKDRIKTAIDKLERRYGTNSFPESIRHSYDSLMFCLFETEKKIEYKKEELKNLLSREELMIKFLIWQADEQERINELLQVDGFRIGWFSFGYGFSNNLFYHFDPLLSFNDQIQKRSYLSHQFRLQYSLYNYTVRSFRSYFFSIGASFGIEDNFSGLSSIEVNE
ncbi:MAG: hypothetical protein PVF73_13415, partial [Bacteroidales bacterium]